MAKRFSGGICVVVLFALACGQTSDEPTEPPAEPVEPLERAADDQQDDQPAQRGGAIAETVQAARERSRGRQGHDWTTYQGNPARTGVAEHARAIVQPQVRWQARVGIQGYLNTPLIIGSTVIVPTSGSTHNRPDGDDGLHALDVRSGEVQWTAGSLADANGASAGASRVVFTSDDMHVRAVEISDGKQAWSLLRKAAVYSTPLVLEDLVVVGDAGGFVVGIALSSGAMLWERRFAGAIRGGLASDGTRIFVVSQGGDVAALALDGTELWKRAVKRPGWGGGPSVSIEGYNAPIVDGERLIIPFARDTYYDTGPAILALSTSDGSELWRAGPGGAGKGTWGNIRSSPAVARGVVVWAEPYSGDVAGIEASSGAPRFRKTLGACLFPQYGSPVVAEDTAYVPRHDGHLNAISLVDGSLLWKLYLGDFKRAGLTPTAIETMSGCEWEVPTGSPLYSPPAIGSDGTVFVGSGQGWLYAIEEAN